MKLLFRVSLLAATVTLAAGCQNLNSAATSQANAAASAQTQTAQTTKFKSQDDKAAYAVGASFATYLKAKLAQPKSLGVELDKQVVLKGFENVFAGDHPQLSEKEVNQAMQDLNHRLQTLAKEKMAQQEQKNSRAGNAFRAKYAQEKGVKRTKSGLLYKVIKPGKGKSPKATDTVKVQYKGSLIDGTVFDSSYARGQAATFPLNRVIHGWTEGVQLMKEGATYEFVIPPKLAYGKQHSKKIPADSTLIFQIKLEKVLGNK